MGRLRHRTAPGCTYFVTTDAAGSKNIFQATLVAEIVVSKLVFYRDEGAYLLHEFVLMPNHLHLILTPGQTTSLEKALQLIKGGSSFAIRKARGNKLPIWQPGFHEWTIRDAGDYEARRRYIWLNPVKAGLIENPEQWPFGSACGTYRLDVPPQGLKPLLNATCDVGAEAPTP